MTFDIIPGGETKLASPRQCPQGQILLGFPNEMSKLQIRVCSLRDMIKFKDARGLFLLWISYKRMPCKHSSLISLKSDKQLKLMTLQHTPELWKHRQSVRVGKQWLCVLMSGHTQTHCSSVPKMFQTLSQALEYSSSSLRLEYLWPSTQLSKARW